MLTDSHRPVAGVCCQLGIWRLGGYVNGQESHCTSRWTGAVPKRRAQCSGQACVTPCNSCSSALYSQPRETLIPLDNDARNPSPNVEPPWFSHAMFYFARWLVYYAAPSEGLSDQSHFSDAIMPRRRDRVHNDGRVTCAHLLRQAVLLDSSEMRVGVLDVTAASPACYDGASQRACLPQRGTSLFLFATPLPSLML